MLPKRELRFKRILCAVDLDNGITPELRYALELAGIYRSTLFIICRAQPHINAARSVKDAIDRCPHDSDVLLWETVIVEGEPEVAIAREAARLHIDLIVMQSQRRDETALLGPMAESLCRTAPCPVLLVHSDGAGCREPKSDKIRLRRVLVAYDFSSDSELALSYGLSLTQQYGAELHLLHVLPGRAKAGAPEIDLLPLGIESAFYNTASRLRNALPADACLSCKITQAVREGRPYREVLAYAEEQGIDLLCMGASGTGFGLQTLFGSNSDRVLRQALCPVLIARPLRPMVAVPAHAQLTNPLVSK